MVWVGDLGGRRERTDQVGLDSIATISLSFSGTSGVDVDDAEGSGAVFASVGRFDFRSTMGCFLLAAEYFPAVYLKILFPVDPAFWGASLGKDEASLREADVVVNGARFVGTIRDSGGAKVRRKIARLRARSFDIMVPIIVEIWPRISKY